MQVFVAEKHFEGCGGQKIDNAIRVSIAAQACLLILHLDHDWYHRVRTILVMDHPLPSRPDPEKSMHGAYIETQPFAHRIIQREFCELPMEARRLTGPLFWLHGDENETKERLEFYLDKVAEDRDR